MNPTGITTRADIVTRIADQLASPRQAGADRPGWWVQSLAGGAPGIALLHIARAHTGDGPWERVHDWLAWATATPLDGGRDCHLHHGAPAVALALHTAGTGHHHRALAVLDHHVAATVRRRLDQAHHRMDRGEQPALDEFDAIRGLTGFGAYLSRRDPGGDELRAVLTYLVRLTDPIDGNSDRLPGWWTPLAPSGRRSPRFPGGHANNGVAHGIGGPLALLAATALLGVRVDGQLQALTRILAWLDRWRENAPAGTRWPYWITCDDLSNGIVNGAAAATEGARRPSWCYGTLGLGRAQQLAALALCDSTRQEATEAAMAAAVTNPGQLDTITDPSLCHGYAGLLHITARAATDACTPELGAQVPRLLDATLSAVEHDLGDETSGRPCDKPRLLEGLAGVGLALHHTEHGRSAAPGWDTWMLMS